MISSSAVNIIPLPTTMNRKINVSVLVQMLPLHSFTYSISCLVKKFMNYDGVYKFFLLFFYSKYCLLLLFSDVIIQRNKLLIFRDLLKFTTKCVGAQIKTVFFFVSLVMQKVKNVKSVNTQSDCEPMRKNRTSCVFTRSRKGIVKW